jgi:phytoene dehydrogenase-like protein
MKKYNAVVIGSGPNGYAAAIYLQRKNIQYCLLKGEILIGGGMRTAELTLPGLIMMYALHSSSSGCRISIFQDTTVEKHGLNGYILLFILLIPLMMVPQESYSDLWKNCRIAWR